MCLWKERRYSVLKHFCRQFMALCFPKESCAHSNPDCVCVCWLISGWIYFQQAFFSLFLSVSCKAVVDFYTAVSWQSNRGPAIKILKASRISYLTFYNTNEASLSLRSGSVSLEKVAFLVCWQLSPPLMIHVFQMIVFEGNDEVNIISVPKFAWEENRVCLLINHLEP